MLREGELRSVGWRGVVEGDACCEEPWAVEGCGCGGVGEADLLEGAEAASWGGVGGYDYVGGLVWVGAGVGECEDGGDVGQGVWWGVEGRACGGAGGPDV